jgi:hypothetical protein
MRDMFGTRSPMNIMTIEEQAKQMAYIEEYQAKKKATQARLYRMMLESQQQQEDLSQELERRQTLRQKQQEAKARKEVRDASIKEKIIKTQLTNLTATFARRLRNVSDCYHIRDEKYTKKALKEVETKPYKQDIKEIIASNLEAMKPNITNDLFSCFQNFLQ